MKQDLSNSVLYLMSVSAGLIVANLYYNQPLLHLMSESFNVSESAISNVALSTQLGYAFGLLFIIPLGDKISNKKILKFDFILMVAALIATAMSNSLWLMILSSFFIGFSSAVPQLFVPMAAQLANPENRGRAIGIVMSGLLIGILGSRVISGLVGEQFGWRVMYYVAAILMVLLYLLLQYKLPSLNPTYKGSYASLLKSIGYYFKTEPSVRLAALRGGLPIPGLRLFVAAFVFILGDSFGYVNLVSPAFESTGSVVILRSVLLGGV